MSLSSVSFLGIYFPLIFIVYYIPFIRKTKLRNLWLLIASISLYAFVEPGYMFLLLIMVILHYLVMKLECWTKNYRLGNTLIVIDVLMLLFFKYINQLLGIKQIYSRLALLIAFPIGLSYYTFKAISYILECRKSEKLQKSGFITAGLYLTNFMSITAGPLGTYDREAVQILERKESKEKVYQGVFRFASGLVKKILIADNLSALIALCFAQAQISLVMAWVGAIAYTLQLYFDFSGYTDMAIGVGNVFGFELPENFNFPYAARSVSEFWKRWHMSLTNWFTRYVYFPLGGSRVDRVSRHLFNLWVVWLCTGIWHGSKLTFILWGMVYFVLQAAEKYIGYHKLLQKLYLGNLYTLIVVIVSWVIFRADSVMYAVSYIAAMFGVRNAGILSADEQQVILKYAVVLVSGILCSGVIAEKYNKLRSKKYMVDVVHHIVLFLLFAISLVIMIGKGYTAPLYAGF